jgi:hypothetical protein
MKEQAHREACSRLGVTIAFSYKGFKVEDWVTDFKNRLAVIQVNEVKDVLNRTESKLNELISSDGKAELELAALKEVLTKV